MTIYRKVLPKSHYEFGFHSNRLANVYWQNEQYKSARQLLMNTISFVKETMPENSPCHAQTLYVMGLDREQAIDYFEQSLKMRQSFQANDHPYAARRALTIRETKLSANHKELRQSIEQVQFLLHHTLL